MRATTISIDTGGTFTDAFVVRDGERFTVKVLTTPHDLAVCFRDVISRASEEVGLTVPELLRETATVPLCDDGRHERDHPAQRTEARADRRRRRRAALLRQRAG
jgi:hypothetical protein